MPPTDLTRLDAQLQRLQLPYIQSQYQALAAKAAEQQRSHLDYLEQLVEGEATMRENRSIERRIRNARFPVLKTLDDFQWSWPKKINRPQIQNLFRLAFIATQTNVVLIGNVGIGKTHLSIALGRAACMNGHSVLFTTAVDIINTLAAAQSASRLKREFQRYLKPAVLIVDELGYLPIDKHGADLLFQIISQRYERAPMVITTNRVYKNWSQIFNNDSTLTSAILDRVLHHADTVIIEGQELPHEGRDRRVKPGAATMTRRRPARSSEYDVSDQAAAYIADALMELALQFEATHFAQIRRHYDSIVPRRDYDPSQRDLFGEDQPF